MVKHEPFKYRTAGQLLEKAEELGVELPFQEDISPLLQPLRIGPKTVPNRLVVQPMEGCDSEPDGSPGELTFRRYQRFAAGGSGMIWFEAVSVSQDGRSNLRQLMLNRTTIDGFKRLVDDTRESARREFGGVHESFLVIQLTHSGRFSKPDGAPLNRAAYFNPYLDRNKPDLTVFTDAELTEILEKLVDVSNLAYRAGFDAVDVKACHGYLVHELLSAHTRKDSIYGGNFENRTGMLLEAVKRIHHSCHLRRGGSAYIGQELDEVVAVRLNATDGIPYPYGFGVKPDGSASVDLTEPRLLIKRLIDKGCSLLNVTAGIPTHSPQMVRPFNKPVSGASLPDEHPLQSVARLINITAELQHEYPVLPMVGSGYSWLSRFFPQVGAAVVTQGKASLIGLGRSSIAYPDAPKDLMRTGRLDPKKTCIACSRCSELMKNQQYTGCAVRDREIYGRLYNNLGTIRERTKKG